MVYTQEDEFEKDVIGMLAEHGWEKKTLDYYTEKDLLENWADILFRNNRDKNCLNDYPLTSGEMGQIMEQIKQLRTPLRLNEFINGREVVITRDNPEDIEHCGKNVTLKIYDRNEIATGKSLYQIARQPRFTGRSSMFPKRRGDLTLLINGMPVFHIELKRSGIPVSQACYQIEKYSKEGVFRGLFSLVQVFVAMNPEETVYFANPGPDGKFNPDYYFHWADSDNVPINDWKKITSGLLSIPMAHQLIGFYTVADKSDETLKVMRSYQCYAADAISDKVAKIMTRWKDPDNWTREQQLGGYVWHTTGAGKTLTAFKSAQLIVYSRDADKVVFLMDRIELGTQSLRNFNNFAGDSMEVQATANTGELVAKLKSKNASDMLIVTSIQKMSNIKDDADGGMNEADLMEMRKKRIVFIIDECHRSTFGDMLMTIKRTFSGAVFFGFTGTPIQPENQKNGNFTGIVFGNELHRYSIADGIRDRNVLGFDPYKVLTYKDQDLREAVALDKARAKKVEDALKDPQKKEVFYRYLNLPMAGSEDENGQYNKGIEDFLPASQYNRKEHHDKVLEDIRENWSVLSHGGLFHALLATSSIQEAIDYYKLFKKDFPELRVTALFDPTIDNKDGAIIKEEALEEIIVDYNRRYGCQYTIPEFGKMKKDIAARLAHKHPYTRITKDSDLRIDLLIVVDQMLTGFDSKWINTLYLDKKLEYENIIQAFSRTNRLFGPEKPFGTIKYYRLPHTMEKNIEKAVKLYSGNKPRVMFVDRLPQNLKKLNKVYEEIKEVFQNAGCGDFLRLPDDVPAKKMFANLFRKLNETLEAARVQGFHWDVLDYPVEEEGKKATIHVELDETAFKVLALRYKELVVPKEESGGQVEDIPYDISGYLTNIDTEDINANYMDSRFKKYLTLMRDKADEEEIERVLKELHKTFASLSQEDQKFAKIFLHDCQMGNVDPEPGKTLRDYINEYRAKDHKNHLNWFVKNFGIDEAQLSKLVATRVTENNINEYGRFDRLKETVDREKAGEWLKEQTGEEIQPYDLEVKIDALLRKFLITGKLDIPLNE